MYNVYNCTILQPDEHFSAISEIPENACHITIHEHREGACGCKQEADCILCG